MSTKKQLTPKQEAFAREYLLDLNSKQAAIRAGYSAKTAEQQGSRLLKYSQVTAYIQHHADKRAEKLDLSAEMVLRELMHLAFLDPQDVFFPDGTIKPLSEMPEAARRAISGIDFATVGIGEGSHTVEKIKLHSKTQALDLLGKHLKLFTERREVEHTGEVTFNMVLQKREE